MKKIVLIPAYEPDELLSDFLRELKNTGFTDIVIVDDGSSGNCTRIFDDAVMFGTVLHHSENRGKGQALKTGMDFILRNYLPSDIVITADADGQHTPSDILAVSDMAESSAMVLGCRDFSKKNIPFRSRFGNKMTASVFHLVSGVKISDTQTGLRCFFVSDIPFLREIEGSGYEYEMNTLTLWAKSNKKLICTPIDTVYINNNSSSHFHPIRDSLRIYGGILKFSLSSVVGFITDYSLYTVLYSIFGAAAVCNIFARIVSSVINFSLNYNFVFDKKEKPANAAAKYFLLAVSILCVNTFLLDLLISRAGANPYLSKLIVEAAMFTVSWAVQKNAVFTGNNRFFRKKNLYGGRRSV